MTWISFFLLMLGGLIAYRYFTLKPVEKAIAAEFGDRAVECSTIRSSRITIDCPTVHMDGILYKNMNIEIDFADSLRPNDLYWQEKVASARVHANLPYESLLKYWRERMFNRFDLRALEYQGDGQYRLTFRIIKIDEHVRGEIALEGTRLKWISDDKNPVSLLLERRGTLGFQPLGLRWKLSVRPEEAQLFISGSTPSESPITRLPEIPEI